MEPTGKDPSFIILTDRQTTHNIIKRIPRSTFVVIDIDKVIDEILYDLELRLQRCSRLRESVLKSYTTIITQALRQDYCMNGRRIPVFINVDRHLHLALINEVTNPTVYIHPTWKSSFIPISYVDVRYRWETLHEDQMINRFESYRTRPKL